MFKAIIENLAGATIKTPLVDFEFKGIELVDSQESAIKQFISGAVKLKTRSIEISSKPQEFSSQLIWMRDFLVIHHALLPGDQWKKQIENAINSVVVARKAEDFGALKSALESVLDAVDASFREIYS